MTSENFEEQYKRLNKKQKEAVDSIEGPVMVIAGPGTGKTTILTLRIANILQKTDTPASGILALTFTEAGVKAMRMKLRDIIGTRANEVRIHTFHGFASSVINEFRDHFTHLDRFKQLTDIEAENIIRTLLKSDKMSDLRPFGNPDFYIQKIIGAISDSKRESYTPDMVRKHAEDEIEKIKAGEDSYSTRGKSKGELKAESKKKIEKCERTFIFADIYKAYENKKRVDKVMDFDDLIYELVIALKHDELLLRMLQEKFLYMLIDEHQDTNNSQNELIKLLADFFDVPNVFIVGDEKQAIYRFQGASVDNFLKFENTWKEMKIIRLEENYRSHQSILDASFSMIENNYIDGEHQNLRVKLSAKSDEFLKPVDVVSAEDTETIEKYLVDELKKLTFKKNINTAVITKTNRDLERILHLCEANNISVSSERSIDIFNHPVGILFFDLIEFICDPTKTDLLAKTLVSGLWGLSFDDSVSIIKLLKSTEDIKLDNKIPILKTIKKEITDDNPLEFIINLAELTGLNKIIAKEPSYVEVWRGITTLSENIIHQGNIQDPKKLMDYLIAYKVSAENKSVKISVGTPDLPIRVMTAHASKGLEFDYVFIPYVTEESWIGKNWGSYFVLPETRVMNDVRDVRRLFYVALTRARSHVVILFGASDHGESLIPLRFIDELDPKHISKINLPRIMEKKDILIKNRQLNNSAKKTIDYAKSILQESGLSVTALNHFLDCPSKFLYQSILKIPQAPSPLAEKGNSMHKAISLIWNSKKRDIEDLEKIMKTTVSNYFIESLLSLSEKETVKKELFEDIPIIAKELQSHFAQKGTIFSEIWSETIFEEAVLHGKLDAVVDDGKEVFVFDYKTKQVMSENEIKGETKNSNGDYFRQLVFYRLLLENDSRFLDKKIIPSLVFVIPDSKGRCPIITLSVENSDIEKLKTEIKSLFDAVNSGSIITTFCNNKKCEWCQLKSLTNI
ncbi:MAG: ATP-dependent helicase [Patescibacteria group bacterium]|nr:ATP-dependent helicase [Patescibacteria group bacterium]